jgi:CDP-paratose 2-epimerase
MKILVTGSGGLIGSAAVEHFAGQDNYIIGIDNNQREFFFGPKGSVAWNLSRLEAKHKNFVNLVLDIRDYEKLLDLFKKESFDVVIHCAAQPSHDRAADFPLVDFGVNATGTINLLEAFRQASPDATFIHMSTNKVYGDAPNFLDLIESEYRFDFASKEYEFGVSESFPIDNSLHSVFGASKVSADVMAQEYGKYFGLNVGIFRGGCLTGPNHSGVELHGFLSYLVKCVVNDQPYTIFGHKGKQVRDQIHSSDVMSAFESFISSPKKGVAFNLGGGRSNSASVIESINLIEEISNKKLRYTFDEKARIGDHICYYSDMRKFVSAYPSFKIQFSLEKIVEDIVRNTFDGS